MKNAKCSRRGFLTLIEIVVTLILVALISGAVVPYITQAVISSARLSEELEVTFLLQNVMEQIVSEYERTYADDLQGLKSEIGNEGTVQDNDFGEYRVVYNRFVEFSGSPPVEQDAGAGNEGLLRVTIQGLEQGELTTLFTEQ